MSLLSVLMLSVLMLSVLMLSVLMLSAIMTSVFILIIHMLIILMLSAFMMSVFMLSVTVLHSFPVVSISKLLYTRYSLISMHLSDSFQSSYMVKSSLSSLSRKNFFKKKFFS